MMRSFIGAVALVLVGAIPVAAQVSSQETDRIRASAEVLGAIHGEPDKDIPHDLWAKARCVVVIPSLKKAAFGFGAEYGKGLMSCRRNGTWGAPVFMELEKGSWGFQIGGESIDLVLLVMNDSGMKKMLQDKVSLGAGVSVAAGPVGRDATASTDAQMSAEILSYSRAQGLFAGIDVSGGVLRPDDDSNHDLYGRGIGARTILTNGAKAPVATQPFMTALRREDGVAPR
jgi:lipid-binding SYLF domain-containing protein